MSLAKDLELLSNIPLFAKVSPAKLKLLGFTSERLQYLSGDELFHQDDCGDAAYVILEGEADILVDTPRRAIKIATLRKTDIIGEIAILCDVPRTVTVVAQGDLDTLRVSKEGFFDLVTEFPQVGIEVMRALASKLHRTTEALTAARAKLDEWGGFGQRERHLHRDRDRQAHRDDNLLHIAGTPGDPGLPGAEEAVVRFRQAEYSPLVSKMQAAGVDILYVGGYQREAGLILCQAHRRRSNDLGAGMTTSRPVSANIGESQVPIPLNRKML